MAPLEASHERAASRANSAEDPPLPVLLANLMFDRERMRFFLSIILEVDDDPTLAAHATGLAAFIAGKLDRCSDDPDVIAFVDALRGAGLRILLEPSQGGAKAIFRHLVANHGLNLPCDSAIAKNSPCLPKRTL